MTHATLPQPKFNIGDEILWDTSNENVIYFRRTYLRSLIKDTRKVMGSLAKDYPDEWSATGKIHEGNKKAIRERMDVFDHPDKVEICGTNVVGSQGYDVNANQCYITGGGSWGAASCHYNVVFRKRIKGDKDIALFTRIHIHEQYVTLVEKTS